MFRKLGVIPKLPDITSEDIMAKSEGGDSFARVISIAQIIWSALGISARSAKGLSNFSARDCSHHHRSMCCFHLSLKLEEAKRHHVAHHHSVFQEQDSSDGFKCFDQRKAARNDNPSFRANPKSLESVPFTRVIPVGCDVFTYSVVQFLVPFMLRLGTSRFRPTQS